MNKDLDSIYFAARELPAEERAAWLTQACGDDEALRARVEQMLAVAEKAENFMGDSDGVDTVILPSAAVAGISGQPGDRIGHYKLLQLIGEGGFGTVWMAEQQQPVSRRVALKIIKLGMDTREVVARFEAERQALAMMDHPNIAKVFDAGSTDAGRPFFVMELVKGVPITQYCDEQRLNTRERLALFGDVCSAINHAHQKGVIHRDIKPTNVMVSLYADKPVVKVIDFGIAKATEGKLTDKTLFTHFGQFIGTPVYMSPEQAALSTVDIDTRSDIYSLGVLLYELLTGKPPFDAKTLASAGYEEMRRIIREVEPPRPSSRLSTVAGDARTTLAKAHRIEPDKLHRLVEPDLDWIVMKAIEKDRTRRYETANGLAQDIQRFLADEPVSATPPSAGYRFRKFARRNKTALRVTAGIAAVLVAATVFSIWQVIRVTRERDGKEVARQDAEAVSKFLIEVFQSPDPERDGSLITIAEVLDRAVRKLSTELAGQPKRRAKLQSTLGNTYIALHLHAKAIPLLESYRDHCMATLGPADDELLDTINNLAVAKLYAGQVDEAVGDLTELLPRRRKARGPEGAGTLKTMSNLAGALAAAGRWDESLKLREEVRAVSTRAFGPENPDTLSTAYELSLTYADIRRYDEALALRSGVIPLFAKALGPEHPVTVQAMASLPVALLQAGQKEEALKKQEEVLPLLQKVMGRDHSVTLNATGHLAIFYFENGRQDEAIKMLEEVAARRRELNGSKHPYTLSAINNLGFAYAEAGRFDEAIKIQEELLELSRKIKGPKHPDTLVAMGNLSRSYAAAGRHEEDAKLEEEGAAAFKALGEKVAKAQAEVAAPPPSAAPAPEKVSPPAEAPGTGVRKLEEALDAVKKDKGPEHAETVRAMVQLAAAYGADGSGRKSIKLGEEALVLARRVLPAGDQRLVEAMKVLAGLYRSVDREDEAKKLEAEVQAPVPGKGPNK